MALQQQLLQHRLQQKRQNLQKQRLSHGEPLSGSRHRSASTSIWIICRHKIWSRFSEDPYTYSSWSQSYSWWSSCPSLWSSSTMMIVIDGVQQERTSEQWEVVLPPAAVWCHRRHPSCSRLSFSGLFHHHHHHEKDGDWKKKKTMKWAEDNDDGEEKYFEQKKYLKKSFITNLKSFVLFLLLFQEKVLLYN